MPPQQQDQSKEILTPESPRWDDFLCRLYDAVGGNCDDSCRCAERVLVEMRDIDVAATLLILEAFHGGCDCEVAANVETIWLDRRASLLKRIQRKSA
jgi:hypothetical protein